MSTVLAERDVEGKQAVATSLAAARIVSLSILFVASAVYEATHVTALFNGNVWLHLRTGLWMLQSHSVPHSGLFSQYSSLPWMDSSWGYDVLLAGVYKLFGLRAIPMLLMVFQIALAMVTFLLAKAGKANFWWAVALSVVAQYVISTSQSLPYGISILFFGIELLLLQTSRMSGSMKGLYWVPALFVLWANLDILFVAGLLLLIIFIGATWIEDLFRRSGRGWIDPQIQPLSLRQVAAVFGGSFLGTLVNPYTFHLIPLAYKALYSGVGFEYFAEMRAMSFRHPQEYALMLLVMAAFLALGRRRSLKIFETLVLIGGILVAFRIQREAWIAVLPAIAILSGGFGAVRDRKSTQEQEFRWERPLVAGIAAAILVIAAFRLPAQNVLISRVSEVFPAKACDFIRSSHLPQPIFDEYSWGSFLTFYLPEYPVATDSRVELYGDDITSGYFKVIAGGERLDAYPSLAAAQTLLLQKQSGVVKALTTLPALRSQYRPVYSDDVAAVFVRIE